MKKLLLTLIVSLAFCGSIYAQSEYNEFYNPNQYDSYYEELYGTQFMYDYDFVDYPGFFVKINGNIVTMEDRWQDFEFASFVGDDIRGHDFLTTEYEEIGMLYPVLQGLMVKWQNAGEEVTFKMYDHATGIEYELGTSSSPVHTGEDHGEFWDFLPEDWGGSGFYEGWEADALFLLFDMPATGIEKEIVGYNDEGIEDMWYFLSSPIGSIAADYVTTTVTNLIGDDDTDPYDFYYFDQAGTDDDKEWKNYKVNQFGFEVGKAYLYAKAAGCTITFNGEAYGLTENGTFDLAYDENCSDPRMKGWNLMGNPYNANATVDKEEFLVMVDGAIVPAESNEIGAMEGILVKAEGEGEFVTFTPNEEGDKSAMFSLNVTSNSKLVDRAVVRFGQGRQLPKFQVKESTKLYIPMDGEEYSVVRSEGMGELPVNFKALKNGRYTLCLNSDNVEFAYLHLIDNLTGADQDLLANPSYSFEAKTTDYANRFKLVFATGSDEDNFAFFSNGSLIINNEGNATLQVVDVTGRIIKCESINGCANVNIDAASGVYMVRLVNGDNMKVQKVVK